MKILLCGVLALAMGGIRSDDLSAPIVPATLSARNFDRPYESQVWAAYRKKMAARIVACWDTKEIEVLWTGSRDTDFITQEIVAGTLPVCVDGLYLYREVRALRPVKNTRGDVGILIEIRWEEIWVDLGQSFLQLLPEGNILDPIFMYTIRTPRPGELEP